ncbi:hypothetical protein EMIHUDRAFT_468761 [Emiliania huxleyi CCMP1516]|uniref:Helicase-associated domain-containing protein n=2 Tax=Emiliania huxleyi TaxID=2903 RepID=A0A0D3JX62_EMIH1|nr:hypothetical protein EMIHUDRAFT_468761 [Emiliania huxleyi CCMP1516]EOD28097.1 hypothetical protein EMIHUDRAFT_468761 [Emiliania huxleyi CCMP1516]|eukprot:XP_005780526.1 hypothetical protein EMIHUDRAFT_468761 [Emiliania huxleyi CCMP1516]
MIGSLFALALLSPRQPPARDARVASMSTASTTARPAVPPSAPPRELDSNHLHLLQATLDSSGGKAAVQRAACAAIVRVFGCSPGDGGGETGRGDGAGGGGAAPGDGEVASRATAVLPSGAGKTVLALRVAEALASSLTVVLIPARDLVSQSHRDWERWRSAPGPLDGLRSLAVCSSTSVPRAVLPRSTDTDVIATFLRETEGAPRVIFCTYQSADRVGAALREVGAAADLLDAEFREALAALVSGEARAGGPLDYSEWPEALRSVLLLPDRGDVQRAAERTVATVARELIDRWERMFGLLQAFREQEGHANVPRKHVEDGEQLGGWLSRQRKLHKQGLLPGMRAQRLEAVGVVWDARAEQWERMFGLLQAFREREAHANVPDRYVEDGEKLGSWLQTQRKRYKARGWSEAERKRGKASAMSDEEVERMEALGVAWDPLAEQWERMFALLQAFKQREGHTNVPAKHVEDGEKLGVWLSDQRKRYKARGLSEAECKRLSVSAMSDGAVERLEAVGVVWDARAEQLERMFGLLQAFREREGHTNVPYRHVEDGEKLGVCLSNQRKRYQARGWSEAERKCKKASAMSDEVVERLEALGVAWDVLAEQWERMFGLLQAFREREGHANVPYRHVEDGEKLGVWLGTQRKRYQARGLSEAERKRRYASALSDEEVERLEALGVVWDVLAEQWERMFGLLQAFREREGHANVPSGHVEDGEKLGSWLSTQRKRYQARGWSEAERKGRKTSAMSDGEVERLEVVGVALVVTPLVLGRRAAVAAGDMLQTERHTQHCVCMACRSNLKKEKRLRNRVNAFRYKKGGFGKKRFSNNRFEDRAVAAAKATEDAEFLSLIFTQSALAAEAEQAAAAEVAA